MFWFQTQSQIQQKHEQEKREVEESHSRFKKQTDEKIYELEASIKVHE